MIPFLKQALSLHPHSEQKVLNKGEKEEEEHARAAEMWVIMSVKQNTGCALPISCCASYQSASYCRHGTLRSARPDGQGCNPIHLLESAFQATNSLLRFLLPVFS